MLSVYIKQVYYVFNEIKRYLFSYLIQNDVILILIAWTCMRNFIKGLGKAIVHYECTKFYKSESIIYTRLLKFIIKWLIIDVIYHL